jgi:NAD+ synthase (glutamine-hydrolysing)
VLAFPEMTLTGYQPEDLVLRRSFVAASERCVGELAKSLADDGHGDLVVIVGHASSSPAGGPLARNTASVLTGGSIVAEYSKHHLPNYGVFDEARYFSPGLEFPVLRLHGIDVGLTICEDLWQEGGPVSVAKAAGVGFLLCTNGSPFEDGKADQRLELAARRAEEAGATLAYVNYVGGQDELVFDGGSFVVGPDGALLARAPQFAEGLLVADLELPAADPAPADGWVGAGDGTAMRVQHLVLDPAPLPAWQPIVADIAPSLSEEEEVWQAVVTGTRDYVEKNGFATVALGLSGGIDSAVTATIAVDALGPDRVHTIALPSAYSSAHSLADAGELAHRQGTRHRVVPIAAMVDAYQRELGGLTGLAEENLQARVRGTALMALSNSEGHLILTTGNKSELATGFSTLYGDSAGGFAPLKDVPKTLVWRLARWRNEQAAAAGRTPPIPEASITKPPSAELAPGQYDSDRLPAYDVLDDILDGYVEGDLSRADLIALGHDPAVVDRVIRLVDTAEYKRRQYPPGPKITQKAFGRDRRLPITSRWR